MEKAGTGVQISLLHTAIGLLLGTTINLMSPSDDDVSSVVKAFETAVVVAVNGTVVALFSYAIPDDDPTFGIPFSVALMAAQPLLLARLQSSAAGLGQLMRAAMSLRIVAPSAAE